MTRGSKRCACIVAAERADATPAAALLQELRDRAGKCTDCMAIEPNPLR